MTRHHYGLAEKHSGAEIPEPVTLPVATRAWCVRDPRGPDDENAAGPKTKQRRRQPRPTKFIALGTECVTSATASMPGFGPECWAAAGQALLVCCVVIGRTADWQIERELIV